MTGAVSHSQPAVSEFTWQDPSDASAEEGPDGFVFYNENDKGLDASGDPREATIQPEVGETGGERGGVGRGGGGRGGGGRGGGGSGGGGRSGGGRGGGGSGGGGSGGGGSGGERDHDDADASVLHENHNFNSASSLPEEFVGHASVASLVNACETFAAQHNFVVQVKGFKYFTADATDATSTPPDDDGDPARSKAIDLGRVKFGQVECHHFGKKRAKTSKVDPTRQRNKPSQFRFPSRRGGYRDRAQPKSGILQSKWLPTRKHAPSPHRQPATPWRQICNNEEQRPSRGAHEAEPTILRIQS